MMKTRENEHQQFLAWLIEVVNQQKIDAVIVAGDIFDSASPASYARKLYADFVVQLQQTNCSQLIVVSGNHDSIAVLNESKSLLKALNVSVLAGLSEDLSEHIIEIENDNEFVQVCALPFLRATDVSTSEHGLSAQQKQMNLQQGISQTYQNIFELAQAKKTGKQKTIIATGHLTAVGCSVSESVRDIYIGTLTAFPASLFPAFDYIALGHLHRPQRVQKSETIRYSGSPIALSFDETQHQKQVFIIETEQRPLVISEVVIPNFQALSVVSGNMEEVIESLTAIKETNQSQSVWVEVKLKQTYIQADLQTRLNDVIEGSGIEILKVSSPQINETTQWIEQEGITLERLTPEQLFEHRLSTESLSEEQVTQLTLLYKQVLNDVETHS
jgi:exonuclease SbcD